MRPVASLPLYRERWSVSLGQEAKVNPLDSRKSGKADGRWTMVVFKKFSIAAFPGPFISSVEPTA